MLIVEVAKIPVEGLDIAESLDPESVHITGETAFSLTAGGTLCCHIEKGDDESVHVQGHLGAKLGLECGRCLDPFELELEHDLDLFYLPHRQNAPGPEEEEEVGLTDGDVVVAYYRDARLDLGEMVREQLFLSVPMRRLCREACRGLCPTCGVNRNTGSCGCAPVDGPDPRWGPLTDLLGRG